MRAAIYARRSTDEHQEESLDVQLEQARRFVEAKGWTVDDAHVFVEDGVSRAEFVKRPALFAMRRGAEAGAFDAIVARDETRLGGDTFRTGMLIQDLVETGIRLFYYYTGEEVTLGTPTDKLMISVRNYAAELEREKIAQRTHEHLLTKARRGLCAGGALFGYDNVRRPEGGVVRSINQAEAAIVLEMFEMRADGVGYRRIAHALNERGVPSPRARTGGTGSWSQGTIKSMLANEHYRGVLVWNRQEKLYKGGTKTRVRRPEEEWIRVEAPEYRIVSDELWSAVRAHDRKRAKLGRRRGKGPAYLLTGLARCAECGGPMHVVNGRQGKRGIKVYACNYHRDRGNSVCTNTLRRPVEVMDDVVLGWIERHVLNEELMLDVLDELRRRVAVRTEEAPAELAVVQKEAEGLHAEIRRLTDALATGAQSSAVIQAVAEREQRLRKLEARIEVLQAAPKAVELEVHRLRREATDRLTKLRELMAGNVAEARGVLEALLDGPIVCTPVNRTYQMRAPLAVPEALGFRSEHVPSGIRTRVAGVKGRYPGPLDDGD